MIAVGAASDGVDRLVDALYALVMSEAHGIQLDPTTLSRLRCPLTRSKLQQEGDWLIAEVGGLSYPIRDGFPCLLIEEAKLPVQYKSLEEFRAQFAPGSR